MPQCLADLVEAYIGALFIDSGFNYAKVQCFFNAHIKPFFEDMTIYDSFANDHPTTRLHHTLSQIYSCQAYQLLCEQVDSSIIGGKPKVVAGLMIHKELVAMVVGESGRYARHRASKKANHELQGLTVKEFKAKFKCDCKAAKEGENGDVVLGDDGAA
jgi:endoribonuclease Dicer